MLFCDHAAGPRSPVTNTNSNARPREVAFPCLRTLVASFREAFDYISFLVLTAIKKR
jgi:hypothetical protein